MSTRAIIIDDEAALREHLAAALGRMAGLECGGRFRQRRGGPGAPGGLEAGVGYNGHWMHRVRMVLAAYRLWQGKTATEAAAELKYREVRDLYRAFHRFFGLTTGEFVEKARGMIWADCAKCYMPRSKCYIEGKDHHPAGGDLAVQQAKPCHGELSAGGPRMAKDDRHAGGQSLRSPVGPPSPAFSDSEDACAKRTDAGHQTERKASPAAFAANLRFWRRTRGLAIKAGADRLGVAHSTWCQWEQGKRAPSVTYIYLLCHVLEVPACALFSEDLRACLSCPRRTA